ncbi:MAG: rhodanese-like domain-containing protein [Calditrichia bacterium]
MKLTRLVLIVIIALLAGLIYNQIHPQGIRIQWLLPAGKPEENGSAAEVVVISAEEARQYLQKNGCGFIDLRDSFDYEVDHIPNAINQPFSHLLSLDDLSFLKQRNCWVIYDDAGNMRNLQGLASRLNRNNSSTFYLMFGGYAIWLENGYPVEAGKGF